jgi:purine-binding chemotaxis protein CheW
MVNAEQFLVFMLEQRRFALPLPVVDSVTRMVEITPLPKALKNVRGIVSLHGRIIPVLDLRSRFDLPERDIGLSDCLIITRTSKRTVAVIADTLEGLKDGCAPTTPSVDILPKMEYLEGVNQNGTDILLVQDLEGFLSPSEEEQVALSLKAQP